jgi:hypothetical protein
MFVHKTQRLHFFGFFLRVEENQNPKTCRLSIIMVPTVPKRTGT